MDEKIKNEWIDMIVDEEDDLTSEEMYSLISPYSKKVYFDLVDRIIQRHSLKEGETSEEWIPVFTQEYRRKFKITAIKYFIEIEKDEAKDNAYIPTYPIQTYPIQTLPTYPNQLDPVPLKAGGFYCTTVSTIN